MLKINSQNFYISTKLAKFSDLIHGFSTREFGDMKIAGVFNPVVQKNIADFVKLLGFNNQKIIRFEQIHEASIVTVKDVDVETEKLVIKNADGGVTNLREILLMVAVADCLPILFYDPVNQVVGLCHAGWKGTIKKISIKMVEQLAKNFGTSPKDLVVAFGPSIGPCHYEVQDNVASEFEKEFSKKSGVVQKRNEKTFIDLRQANLIFLIQAKVLAVNIDSQSLCTFCHNDVFYSYRQEKENLAGEIGAVVGLKFNPQSRQ